MDNTLVVNVPLVAYTANVPAVVKLKVSDAIAIPLTKIVLALDTLALLNEDNTLNVTVVPVCITV